MRSQKKIHYFLVSILLLLSLLGLRITFSEKIESISVRVFDLYQKLKPRAYVESPVRFVDIDDASLEKYGQWPWPRTLLADLIHKLTDNGAAVIVLDVLFSEKDRTSPANILPYWDVDIPALNALNDQVDLLPDHDEVFSEALSKSRVVSGFTLTTSSELNEKIPAAKAGFAHSGENPIDYLPRFEGAITNIPSIEKASDGSGSLNYLAESDGVLRRVPLIFRYQDRMVPSLVSSALRVAQGASSYIVKTSGGSGTENFGVQTGITQVKIGHYIVPTDSHGQIWLYDSGRIQKRYLPAADVLSDEFDSKLIEGNIVFIGSSAAGLKDLRMTPLSPVMAGTEVHIQLVEQILHQQFLSRPDWALGAEIIFMAFVGVVLVFALPFLGAILSAILGLLAISFAFGFSWHAFADKQWLVDPVTPSATALIIYLVITFMNYLRSESEKNQIRGAFGQYVSPALLQEISKHPESLKLGGETRPMTILFSDIRNFTTLSEKCSAEELTRFMNRYLTPMTDVILKSGGTIDKYIGDCIMAFWNAPLKDSEHAQNACQTALKMQNELKILNQQMQKEAKSKGDDFSPIGIGIGINTGNCSVGNMGSDQRFDYSVLGDDVNLASRLEGQSKFYGIEIILGEKTYKQVSNLAMIEIDITRVKGKSESVKVYALLGGEEVANDSAFKKFKSTHDEMIEVYRAQNWTKAEELVLKLMKTNFGIQCKVLYQLYHDRIKEYAEQPIDSSWDGVNSLIRAFPSK